MRSSYPRSPIDHQSNGSKSQMFGQLQSLFLIFFFGVTLLRCHALVHLWFFPQVDSVAFLIDTCRVKDPDRALVPQFYIVHELYPT
jgi:hypothetical protein